MRPILQGMGKYHSLIMITVGNYEWRECRRCRTLVDNQTDQISSLFKIFYVSTGAKHPIVLLDLLYKLLYNIYMQDISDIFTSKARVKILRTLYFQLQPTPLRHIAYISDLPIFSVQNATKSLLSDKIINKREKENYILFELNKKHPLYTVLEQFFIIEINNRISREAQTYFQKAKQALEFANAANIIFTYAKKRSKK